MICAYCMEDIKATKEHIIPKGIIELFPECDLAFDFVRGKVYPGEAVIKDVCSGCNGGVLSSLDSYGKRIIETYFTKDYLPYEILEINYDYDLLVRWLLKLAYNSARAEGTNIEWFQNNLDYINGKIKQPLCKISLFGGFWANMSPVPSSEYGNLKVQIIREPQLLQNGSINFETCQFDEFCIENAVDFPGMDSKYLFRFGSAMFLIFIWSDTADRNSIENYEKIFTHLFPYNLFGTTSNRVELARCTDAFNCHAYLTGLIHGLVGMSISEQCVNRITGGKNIENMRERFYDFFGTHKIEE